MLVGIRLFAFLPTRSVFQRVVVVVVLDARRKQLFSPTTRVVIVVVVVVFVAVLILTSAHQSSSSHLFRFRVSPPPVFWTHSPRDEKRERKHAQNEADREVQILVFPARPGRDQVSRLRLLLCRRRQRRQSHLLEVNQSPPCTTPTRLTLGVRYKVALSNLLLNSKEWFFFAVFLFLIFFLSQKRLEMKTNEKRRTPEEEEEEDEKEEEEERERRENDSQHTQRDLYKTHIESISEREKTSSSSIRTTTTTPFSVSLEDIYIYIYRGFVDTFSRRRNKGFGERSELVLDSDISS